MTQVDQTRSVREGEELDAARLESYLRGHLNVDSGPLQIEQFPGGHSNLTYLIRLGGMEYVLRRPPFGSKVKTAHDMSREYKILSPLSKVYPAAPSPLLHCEDLSVIGAPFYVMNRIRGVILRKEVPDGLPTDPDTIRNMAFSLIDNLASLHAVDYRSIGLGDFGKPQGYVERQVQGWTRRYSESKTDVIPEVEQIAAWLAERIPTESGAALIHNDYKYDNIVLDPNDLTRIIGVLDWEMSTIGDPLMDLGTTLSYWVQADDSEELQMTRFGPTHLPGSPTRRELAARYGEKTGRDVSNLLFYYCFALFKTAVVIQQIYYRYAKGLTKDERFAPLIYGVGILSRTAVHAAESGRM